MSISVTFPEGATERTAYGLHQWDRGQKLNIIFNRGELPLIGEVHFARPGMKEAVVRVVAFIPEGTEVDIPDICLEQAGPLTVCMFNIDSTSGTTVKKINMPIESRPRPYVESSNFDAANHDKHTGVITEAPKAVAVLKNAVEKGPIKMHSAARANVAKHTPNRVKSVKNANTATYAKNAFEEGWRDKDTIDARIDDIAAFPQARVAEAGFADKAKELTPGLVALKKDTITNRYSLPSICNSDGRVYVLVFTTSAGSGWNLDYVVPSFPKGDGGAGVVAKGPGCPKTGDKVEVTGSQLQFSKSNGYNYTPNDVYYRVL